MGIMKPVDHALVSSGGLIRLLPRLEKIVAFLEKIEDTDNAVQEMGHCTPSPRMNYSSA